MFLGEAADPCRSSILGFRSWGIWGLGLRVQDLGSRLQGLGSRVEGSGLELRCGAQGLIKVQGLGVSVRRALAVSGCLWLRVWLRL